MLTAFVNEINARAARHEFGRLQEIRKRLKGLSRISNRQLLKTFKDKTTSKDKTWAFHHGGRKELQFNVGLETLEDREYLRYGVAFSFEPSPLLVRAKIDILKVLLPKVKRFNEFLRIHPEQFNHLRRWYWWKDKGRDKRSERPDQVPSPIQPELVAPGVFVFLGRLQATEAIDYEVILGDFDRLLPLYEFVEGTSSFPSLTPSGSGFQFRAGCRAKQAQTTASVAEQQLDVDLRHNQLQEVLYDQLSQRFGVDAAGTENMNGIGGRIDAVVKQDGSYWFYEIKTAGSAQACIRQALPQLLEYSYWPGAQEAKRLVIVGEPEQDDQAREYMTLLRRRFSLPVYYQQINLEQRSLVPAEPEN